MHIDVVPNRNSQPAYLRRESDREGGKVKKRTRPTLSSLSIEQIETIRQILRGEQLAPGETPFEAVASAQHGHVQAVLAARKRLRFDAVLPSRPCRERDLVMAMVAARILEPHSKLATTRWWHVTTLPEILGVCDATEDDLYDAMDRLLARQERIEKKLSARHLRENGLGLYDLTSSHFEGSTRPPAAPGDNR